jgi:phosphoribosylglycinamide formyltransferase-1
VKQQWERAVRPQLLVFASGSASGGGSGFENLVVSARRGRLDADFVGVVSNYADGGVRRRAEKLGVPFIPFEGPWTAARYQEVASRSKADFFALSGWLKLVRGLDFTTRFNSKTVFNIHPGPLPQFGGKGMHGHFVHEKVLESFRKGELTHSAVTMHFVTDMYDQGPAFFSRQVPILDDDTPESLGERVNRMEHACQPDITDLVVSGAIRWDGEHPRSLKFPAGYAPHA